jgi:hypothetical protein
MNSTYIGQVPPEAAIAARALPCRHGFDEKRRSDSALALAGSPAR